MCSRDNNCEAKGGRLRAQLWMVLSSLHHWKATEHSNILSHMTDTGKQLQRVRVTLGNPLMKD